MEPTDDTFVAVGPQKKSMSQTNSLNSLPPKPSSRASKLDWVVFLFSLIALSLSSYLAIHANSKGQLIGCNEADLFSCDKVLGSRWSQVLGIPVAYGGVATYVFIVACAGIRLFAAPLRSHFVVNGVLIAAAYAAAAAGIWFAALQFFVIEKLCWYCMSVHCCGIAIATLLTVRFWLTEMVDDAPARIELAQDGMPSALRQAQHRRLFNFIKCAGLGVGMIAVMASVQIFFAPAGHQVTELKEDALSGVAGFPTNNNAVEMVAEDPPVVPSDEPAPAKVDNPPPNPAAAPPITDAEVEAEPKGRFDQALLIGNRRAEHAIVEILDYTCEHCRTLYPTLERVLAKYPEQLAIVVVPVAVDKSCNRYVTHIGHRKEVACKYARLAMAVWMLNREAFMEFHRWMLEGELNRYDEAWRFAGRLVGTQALLDTIDSPAIAQRMEVNSKVWNNIGKTLPTLVVGGKTIQGTVPNDIDLETLIESYLPFNKETSSAHATNAAQSTSPVSRP